MERFDALGDAGLRAALLYVRGMPVPVTADETASALRIHRTVARSRLERLLRAGLLETRFARRNGRSGPGAGRPAKLYAPTPQRRALEFPQRRLASIVGRLVEEIPVDRRRAALRRVGEDYGREVARAAGVRPVADLRKGFEALCGGLRSLGFPAVLDGVDASGAVIATPDCPLRPLVRDQPDAAEIDHGMWAGLAERAMRGLAAADVRCTPDGCCEPGRPCRVRLAVQRAG